MKLADKKLRSPKKRVRSRVNPPMFRSNLVFSHKFRFEASAAFNGLITSTSILGACGGIGTVTNTTIALWTTSVKVRSVELWAAPAALGAGATVSINWFGANNSPNLEVSDTSLSTAFNAHVISKPPPSSTASFWQRAAVSTNMFTLVVPTGAVVDLEVDMVMADQDVALATAAPATAVVGTVYYLALDFVSLATHVLVPVSLATTF